MKTLRILTIGLVLAAGAASAIADDEDDKDRSPVAEARFPQPVIVGKLIGRTVLQPLESQPVLGRVARIVRTKDGAVDVVVDYGGFFGFGTRPIAVPLTAVALLGEDLEIIAFTPDQLKAFPTFESGAWTTLPGEETVEVGLAKPAH